MQVEAIELAMMMLRALIPDEFWDDEETYPPSDYLGAITDESGAAAIAFRPDGIPYMAALDILDDDENTYIQAGGAIGDDGRLPIVYEPDGRVRLIRDTETDFDLDEDTLVGDLVSGQVDEAGRLPFAYDEQGRVQIIRIGEIDFDDDEDTLNVDLASGTLDKEGRIGYGVSPGGELIDGKSLAEGTQALRVEPVNGYLQVFRGSAQLTSGAGDHFDARAISGSIWTCLSTRWAGELVQYRVRADGVMVPAGAYLDMILMAGQSLSVGVSSTGFITISPTAPIPEWLYMFPMGVRGSSWSAIPAGGLAGLVPLREQQNGTNYDTHATGIGIWAFGAVADRPSMRTPLLLSCHGAGGASYNEIRKGGVYDANSAGTEGERTYIYERGLEQVQAAAALAAIYGKQARVRAVPLTHGEDDSGAAAGIYYGYLQDLHDSWRTDIVAITEQPKPPVIMIDQMGSRPTSAVPIDQLQFCVDHPDSAIMPLPKWWLNWLHSDGSWSHLSPTGYTLMGEYHGIALEEFLRAGRFEPMRPVSATRDGAVVTVTFSRPVVIDATTVPAVAGAGARFYAGSAEIAISSYEKAGTDSIAFTLASAPASGAEEIRFGRRTLVHANSYAYPIINIRDESPLMSKLIPGTRLHNWCVMSTVQL